MSTGVSPQQTDWTEPWLTGLAVFHVLCLLLTCVSSRRYELQVGHFLCLGEYSKGDLCDSHCWGRVLCGFSLQKCFLKTQPFYHVLHVGFQGIPGCHPMGIGLERTPVTTYCASTS